MFIITAVVFTGLGFIFGFVVQVKTMSKQVINKLADMGYLRYEVNEDGTKDILKIDGSRG